ncbi:MAG: lysophospholipid acyltransferase family protein [Chlamydiae bacterium]|nr:lysophospholipid acyltransferase family protein [Chlamydiota bacterium]MBI3278166.1 lysophospholipid acyltransferase family protein [Chlamydiota bacterium]
MRPFLFYKFLEIILKLFPFSWSLRFIPFLFKLGSSFTFQSRKVVEENLHTIGLSPSLQKNVNKVFEAFGRYLVFFLSPFRFKEYWIKQIQVQGLDHLKRAYNERRGVIILSSHLGNWEMAVHKTLKMGLEVSAVFSEHLNPQLETLFSRHRKREGLSVISWKKDATTQCLQALRKGRLLAIAGDIDFTKTGVDTIFFGKKTKIPKGPIVLAKRTGALIVPGGYLWNERGGDLFFDEAIDPKGLSEEELGARVTRALEKMICLDPTQWLCFERVWK